MATLGYARVSTTDQSLDRQMDELIAAGAERVYSDIGSGKKDALRPQWDELLRSLRSGDTLVVAELSRLGRSTSQLSALADDLSERQDCPPHLESGNRYRHALGTVGVFDYRRCGGNGAGSPNRADELWIGGEQSPWTQGRT